MIVYVDTSAALKRILVEHESAALVDYLDSAVTEHDSRLVTATLTRVETARRLVRDGVAPDDVHSGVANALTGIDLVPVDRGLERSAMTLPGRHLRSLDALHLAAAQHVTATEFVTYDKRQAESARAAGFSVVSPGTD